MAAPTAAAGGLRFPAAMRDLLAALLDIGRVRLELASTELQQERLRLAELLIYAVLALFFVSTGLVIAAILIAVLFWDSHRVAALAGEAALFLVLGGWLGHAMRRKARQRPPLFAATLDELRRDGEALRQGWPVRR